MREPGRHSDYYTKKEASLKVDSVDSPAKQTSAVDIVPII